jgi:serine-type D-Ala-D-Ala carboxypeptidase/endopeptidase (penicillin-binding protein 4)
MKRLGLAVLMVAAAAHGASLAKEIERLLTASPAAKTAFWGIDVVDLGTGKTLYALNADHFFVPASNTKLFTTALALSRLGPSFTFQTRVLADAAPDAEGQVAGLRLVGGGDPNLSGRALPYRMGAPKGDPLGAIEDLAAQLAARGVKHVAGDIVGDDTWYAWQPYAVGWGIDDPESDDGPPISALTVNDNVFSLTVRPGQRAGDSAVLSLAPAIEFFRIDNRVLTTAAGGERRVRYSRLPGSYDLHLWGEMPVRVKEVELLMAVEDPARYAAMALRAALEERGIAVEGEAVSRHAWPGEPVETPDGVELARRVSAPFVEDLRVTDKVSQNLHAELALRAVAKARQGVGSFEAGRAEMKTFLGEVGIAPESYNFSDGSGLARLNLVTPAAVLKLLRFMHGGPQREDWVSLLPVGGKDGTLSNRFGDSPGAGRVFAKTGSLSHVSALSGYIHRADGRWAAFSILVNNYNAPAAEVRGVMDRICNLVVE